MGEDVTALKNSFLRRSWCGGGMWRLQEVLFWRSLDWDGEQINLCFAKRFCSGCEDMTN